MQRKRKLLLAVTHQFHHQRPSFFDVIGISVIDDKIPEIFVNQSHSPGIYFVFSAGIDVGIKILLFYCYCRRKTVPVDGIRLVNIGIVTFHSSQCIIRIHVPFIVFAWGKNKFDGAVIFLY
ncbi:hypothetical protein D3C86_943280 [compost metagenome]